AAHRGAAVRPRLAAHLGGAVLRAPRRLLAVHQARGAHRMSKDGNAAADAFRVTPWMNRLGRWTCDRPRLMRRIAGFETRLLADRLSAIPILAPVWITGLARSGTTIVMEILAAHPDVATQY